MHEGTKVEQEVAGTRRKGGGGHGKRRKGALGGVGE